MVTFAAQFGEDAIEDHDVPAPPPALRAIYFISPAGDIMQQVQ
jgi:hypothetical protein